MYHLWSILVKNLKMNHVSRSYYSLLEIWGMEE